MNAHFQDPSLRSLGHRTQAALHPRLWRCLSLGAGLALAWVGTPLGHATTNVFLETFDHWPSAPFIETPGAAKATNWFGEPALEVAQNFPGTPATAGWNVGIFYDNPQLIRGHTLEQRVDVLDFTASHGGYIAMGCLNWSSDMGIEYCLDLGEHDLVLVKYQMHPETLARFLCEDIAFPLRNIAVVLSLTPQGESLAIRVQVLDKANGDATLFDRTVWDTPAQDVVSTKPWVPGVFLLNEDPGPPYLGGMRGWVGLMHNEPVASEVRVVFDNFQSTLIGVGVDEFRGEVFTNALGRTLPYRLFVPANYDPAQRYPLVLSLHGMGEIGTDNQRQVTAQPVCLLFAAPEYQNRQPCFLLAPQSPGDWMDVVDRVLDLLTELQTRYSIDPDRLYVTGLSMGGWGTFDYLTYRPLVFAAGIPMSCATGPASQSSAVRAARISQIPLWVFCGALDTDYDHIGDVRRMVEALRAAGGCPIYTEYSRGGHTIGADAYQTPGLYEWLMAQRRGQPMKGPPALTIQSPTQEATWTTWSTEIDLAGAVSPDQAVSLVWGIGVPGVTRRALGTNAWSIENFPLRRGVTNTLVVRAHAPSASAYLGGETTVSQTLRVVQKQLALHATLAGDVVNLQWTPGAAGYVVERCTDLAVPDWLPIQTTTVTELTLPRTAPQAYYRVKLNP